MTCKFKLLIRTSRQLKPQTLFKLESQISLTFSSVAYADRDFKSGYANANDRRSRKSSRTYCDCAFRCRRRLMTGVPSSYTDCTSTRCSVPVLQVM